MKYLFVLFLVSLSLSSNAAFTTSKTVERLIFTDNGAEILLKEFTNSSNEVSCGSDRFILLNTENSNYKARIAFLLTAFVQQTTLKFSYYGCEDELIRVSSVHLD